MYFKHNDRQLRIPAKSPSWLARVAPSATAVAATHSSFLEAETALLVG
jgi:hypothetical protein